MQILNNEFENSVNYIDWLSTCMVKSKTRKITPEELEKLKSEEKIRNDARRTGQKEGVSISTDKSKLKSEKPDRPARKIKKKRVSVR